MSAVEKHIREMMRTNVWGGFDSLEEVQDHVDEMIEDEGAEDSRDTLTAAVLEEFKRKAEAEKSWPAVTDVDRLHAAFLQLKNEGILCLHNAGFTMTDGHEDAWLAIEDGPANTFHGYCFYHGQDLAAAVGGHGLYLAFDHVKENAPDQRLVVGQTIKAALEQQGFEVVWDGTVDQRLKLPKIRWQNRGVSDEY